MGSRTHTPKRTQEGHSLSGVLWLSPLVITFNIYFRSNKICMMGKLKCNKKKIKSHYSFQRLTVFSFCWFSSRSTLTCRYTEIGKG